MGLAILHAILAFSAQRAQRLPRTQLRARAVSLAANPTIYVGATLPSAEVQTKAGAADIRNVLGKGRSILVGMPGAFTPTCTNDHLPGLIRSAPALADLNIKKIVVVTANDNYVNTAWSQSVCSCLKLDQGNLPVEFAADPVGELLEALGTIAFLGKGLGVRSKRFALIAEDGVVKHVVIEEDPDQLTVTSAEALLSVAGVLERKARSAAAEMAVAAEIYKMKPLEALAFLKAQSATLLAAGMDADELNEAIDIVAGASGFASAAQGGTTEGGAAAEPSSAATIGAALAALAIGAGAYYVYGAQGGDLSKLGFDVSTTLSTVVIPLPIS
jgi:glutaredoxin/glutathione-dependent peroxiredoxin